MADPSTNTDENGAAAGKSGGILPWVIVGVVASSIGATVPLAMTLLSSTTSAHATETTGGHSAEESHGGGHGSSHGSSHGSGHGSSHGSKGGSGHGSAVSAASNSPMVFIPYGEVTVNLDEQRLNRYLRVKVALHVRRSDESAVRAVIAEKELLLRNWLVSHLSDKELNDIRGKAGQNMLRREIRDHFNTALFPDHFDRIYDVLFQEFNVQ
ncbi:MAG TPA: flagellar basal body-associated FliL family protein [Planctomicrobium sp.]|nr:flagellar basal body-associated FliL family protein [Planctomicrobium sp.]